VPATACSSSRTPECAPRDPILFTFLPTQFTLDLMDAVSPALFVFYCTDKFSETSPAERRILPYERRVIECADLVFVSSDRLADYCHAYNPETPLPGRRQSREVRARLAGRIDPTGGRVAASAARDRPGRRTSAPC
jgi:hypothetical protein